MLEQLPTNRDAFFGVQIVATVYLLLVAGITAGVVLVAVPLDGAVKPFVIVGLVLAVPFYRLVRRVYPEPVEV